MARYGKKRKLPDIPADVVVEEILSHLPCKSLTRLRCVSKQWNSLILRDQNLIRLNHTRSSIDTTGHKVLLRTNPFRFMNLDITNFNKRVVLKGRTPPPLIPDDSTFTEVVGECTGVFCIVAMCVDFNTLRSTRRFILWNPATGESEQVCSNNVRIVVHPNMGVGRSQIKPLPRTFHMCGFGYDSSSDDYKIVCLEGSRAMPLSVQIYTVGSQTWKKMEHSVSDMIRGGYFTYFNNRGSFLRGACHWPFRKLHGRRNAILSFDFETEQVREVTLPPCLSENILSQELRVFDGKLVLTNQINYNEVEIWVMNEYGVGSSFTKKVTLGGIPKSQSLRSFIPVCFLRNGFFLVCDGKRLIGYDLEKKTYKVVMVRGCRQDISVYTESLISPRMMKKIKKD